MKLFILRKSSHCANVLWQIVILVLASCLISNAYALQNTVLIISTDESVVRYREIATEFKAILQKNAYHWQEYDLGSNHSAEDLKQQIQAEKIGIVFCIGTKAYSEARHFAEHKKIIFSAAINWRRLGIDSKTYGISNELTPFQEMSLLRHILPSIKTIGLLFNAKQSQEYIETIKAEAKSLNIKIVDQEVDAESDISGALDMLLPNVDIFWIIPDPVVLGSEASVQQIFQSAKQFNKPVYSYSDIFVAQGAVLSVSVDTPTVGRQAANMALLMETNPLSEGAVQIPAGSMITVNKCIIDKLHLKFNQDALESVNKIVDCHASNK